MKQLGEVEPHGLIKVNRVEILPDEKAKEMAVDFCAQLVVGCRWTFAS